LSHAASASESWKFYSEPQRGAMQRKQAVVNKKQKTKTEVDKGHFLIIVIYLK